MRPVPAHTTMMPIAITKAHAVPSTAEAWRAKRRKHPALCRSDRALRVIWSGAVLVFVVDATISPLRRVVRMGTRHFSPSPLVSHLLQSSDRNQSMRLRATGNLFLLLFAWAPASCSRSAGRDFRRKCRLRPRGPRPRKWQAGRGSSAPCRHIMHDERARLRWRHSWKSRETLARWVKWTG